MSDAGQKTRYREHISEIKLKKEFLIQTLLEVFYKNNHIINFNINKVLEILKSEHII